MTTVEAEAPVTVEPAMSDAAASAAKQAKGEDKTPCFVILNGHEYIYTGLSRAQWRAHNKKQNKLLVSAQEAQDLVLMEEIKEDAKEQLVNSQVLFSSEKVISAGAIEYLSDFILMESGFGPPEMEPVRL